MDGRCCRCSAVGCSRAVAALRGRSAREKTLVAAPWMCRHEKRLRHHAGRPLVREGCSAAKSAQRGDRAAHEDLLRRFEPLVQRVVRKLRPPLGYDREDLAQEARLGLLAAIRAWRPERGPFPAFADRCVSNQALLAVKAASAHKHQVLSLAVSLDRRCGRSANSSRRWGCTDAA